MADITDIRKCRWVPGYVTEKMFTPDKPFYVSWGKHFGYKITSADDVNRMFTEIHR